MLEAPEDEAQRFLDLAAFADGRLDDDEAERVAEQLALDPAATADIAAARAFAQSAVAPEAVPAVIMARACALVEGSAAVNGAVVVLALRRRPTIRLYGVARWGSLAAALVLAGWLGFTLGMDTSQSFGGNQVGEEGFLHELFNPATGFMNDLTGGTQT